MNFLFTLKSLYAINGVVAVAMYVPQCLRAWKGGSADSISLVTFGGWGIGSAITVLYAWLCVRDTMFITVSTGNLIGCGAIISLVAARRFLARRQPQSAGR